MKRIDYTEYDEKLLKSIREGYNTFSALDVHMDEENKKLQPVGDRWRIIDRRLTALKKKGIVVFHGRKWHVQG
jgi:hypothetical protein